MKVCPVGTKNKGVVNSQRARRVSRTDPPAAARRTLDLTSERRRILARRLEGNSPWIFRSKRNLGMRLTRRVLEVRALRFPAYLRPDWPKRALILLPWPL